MQSIIATTAKTAEELEEAAWSFLADSEGYETGVFVTELPGGVLALNVGQLTDSGAEAAEKWLKHKGLC